MKLFVALGTQKFPFDRLVNRLNQLVSEGLYNKEDIVIQSMKFGKVLPVFTHYETIPVEQFNEFMDEAEVIITHSGVNSILTGMARKKPLVIVPRMCKYGEHVDDHQLEIAKVMEEKYHVLVARDLTDLGGYIQKAKLHEYLPYISQKEQLLTAVRNIIDNL